MNNAADTAELLRTARNLLAWLEANEADNATEIAFYRAEVARLEGLHS